MMHATITEAVQASIEVLESSPRERVLNGLRLHGDPGLLRQYDDLLTMTASMHTSSVGWRGTSLRASWRRQAWPDGSLGAAVHACDTGTASSGLSVGDDASFRAALRDVEPIARAVLGYGDGPIAAWAFSAFMAAQVPSLERYLEIGALFARVGFVDPEAAIPVYEAFATGWLHGKFAVPFLSVNWDVLWSCPLKEVRSTLLIEPQALPERERWAATLEQLRQPQRLPEGLPPMLWKVIDAGVDPATITPSIAAFGMAYDQRLKDACARAILLFDGQPEVARQPWPPRVAIDSLRDCVPGTLGYEYYHLIVDNGFDPEVLDPDSVTGFHPGLDGTNRRILQTHEVWHLVAGYSTSPLHETAISAFQLAQFGHNYSAIFLATITLLLTFTQPAFVDPVLQVIAEGWRHGRQTRPLMLVDWFALWEEPITAIRRDLGIEPFRSVIPDLLAPSA